MKKIKKTIGAFLPCLKSTFISFIRKLNNSQGDLVIHHSLCIFFPKAVITSSLGPFQQNSNTSVTSSIFFTTHDLEPTLELILSRLLTPRNIPDSKANTPKLTVQLHYYIGWLDFSSTVVIRLIGYATYPSIPNTLSIKCRTIYSHGMDKGATQLLLESGCFCPSRYLRQDQDFISYCYSAKNY